MRLTGLLAAAALSLSSLFPAVSHSGAVPDPFPGAAAAYLVQVDGRTLWAHQADRRLPVASITKIMTALIVLESCRLDEVVTISRTAAGETGSRLGLRPGEKMTVGELLAAALLRSGNDACRALAEHAAGDEARFVSLMNRRARALGLSDTRYANACGHDDERLYSTARDTARLAAIALANPVFAKMVSLVRGEVGTIGGGRVFVVENTNEIVGRYEGAEGVKSGFTRSAGKCLVALARRDGTRVLLVLLNAPDRWWTAVEMMDKAFAEAKKARPD